MIRRVHIPLVLAGLVTTGVAAAWAQSNSGNPWRVEPRTAPAGETAEDERGFTQGYLRGFEQGYRRGAEQATGGAPTANLGPPAATGSTGHGKGVLSDTAPTGLTPPRQPTTVPPPVAALPPSNDHAAERSFTPKPSQWGEYPPLESARAAPQQPAPRPPAAAAYPAPSAPYPYPPPPAQQPATALPPAYAPPPGYAPAYGAPYPYGGYGPGYGYGYASPYASPYATGPSTLSTPFGGSPLGLPGLSGPGMGFW